MSNAERMILLLGESDVGKTHYGAQVLRRLNAGLGAFELVDAKNLTPFTAALDKISQGLSAPHTPRSEYTESRWSLRSKAGDTTTLVWPDYGGEQVTTMVDTKSLPVAWRDKLTAASGWIFMVRPSQVPLPEDILTRPAKLPTVDGASDSSLSPQSKLVEILQMLQYKARAYVDHQWTPPPLAVLLSCYDELATGAAPSAYCLENLPMFYHYLTTNWPRARLNIFGVSPLGQPLSEKQPDNDYAASGPESKGFVIDSNGDKSQDLLAPIQWLLSVATSS